MQELSGEALARVSDAVVGIWTKHHGRGPREAKSFVADDFLFTVLRGGMTPQERTLAERGERRLVRQLRGVFEEVLRPDYEHEISQVTGCRVLDYQSQVLVDAEATVEIFVLERS